MVPSSILVELHFLYPVRPRYVELLKSWSCTSVMPQHANRSAHISHINDECSQTCIRGGNQNIPNWCRYQYSSFGSTKHRSQRAKLWIPGSAAYFCGDCVKTYEDVTPRTNLAASQWQRPVSHFHPHPAVSGENKIAVILHPPYSPDLAPCDFFLLPKMKLKQQGRRFDTVEEIRAESPRVLDTDRKWLPGSFPKM
jgi:hypothetical protein